MDAGPGMNLSGSSAVADNQAVEIVAVRSVGAESLLIKQALDAATQANLIGIILEANRPTHLPMPATAEDHDSRRSQPGRNHAQRPQPARLLFLLTHLPQPINPSKTKHMLNSGDVQWSSESMNWNKLLVGLPKSRTTLLTLVRREYCDYPQTSVTYE